MNFLPLFVSFSVLISFLDSPAFADDGLSKARIVAIATPVTLDVKAILSTVEKVYRFSGRDYICVWEAKKIKRDLVSKFRRYFSEEIIEKFFTNNKACEVVGAARYGFVPLDDPTMWNDQQYKLVRIESAEVDGDKATVEVRFWTALVKKKDPLDQDRGGTILSLIKVNKQWKVANIESTWTLGGEGFHSLLDEYPRAAHGEWKDMDYKSSLKRPHPF